MKGSLSEQLYASANVHKLYKEQRNSKRLTQLRLASVIGVTKNTIAKWESGKVNIPKYAWIILDTCEKEPLRCPKCKRPFKEGEK